MLMDQAFVKYLASLLRSAMYISREVAIRNRLNVNLARRTLKDGKG